MPKQPSQLPTWIWAQIQQPALKIMPEVWTTTVFKTVMLDISLLIDSAGLEISPLISSLRFVLVYILYWLLTINYFLVVWRTFQWISVHILTMIPAVYRIYPSTGVSTPNLKAWSTTALKPRVPHRETCHGLSSTSLTLGPSHRGWHTPLCSTADPAGPWVRLSPMATNPYHPW